MAREDEVVGGQFEGAEQVRGDHSGQVVQSHAIELMVEHNLAEKPNYEDEYVPVDLWQVSTDFFEFSKFKGRISGILQVAETTIKGERAQGLAHRF